MIVRRTIDFSNANMSFESNNVKLFAILYTFSVVVCLLGGLVCLIRAQKTAQEEVQRDPDAYLELLISDESEV